MASLNPNKLTILQGFKKLPTDKKLDELYVEVIKLKRRIRFLNEFQNMSLPQFVSKQIADNVDVKNVKNIHYSKEMDDLNKSHRRIKDQLTIFYPDIPNTF